MNNANKAFLAAAVSLFFMALSPAATLTISPAPTLGNVTSNIGGINCGTGGSSCVSSSITAGVTVTLTAAPTLGGCTFVQWSVTSLGTSTSNPLSFPMPSTAQTGTATFHGLAPSITSAASTTFTVGTAGSFNVTGTGCSSPTFSVTAGSLPSGVTLASNGTLAGTPAAGTGGSYPMTITASNGTAPSATQSFTLAVNQAPAITSANATTFSVGTLGSFNFTATGSPAPTFAITSGALPGGVTLSSGGALSGTPSSGTAGVYPVTVTASNGTAPNATQSFTLTVSQPPVITSAASTTFAVGAPGTFNFTATGSPAPSIAITAGGLPEGVTFSGGVLSGTPTNGAAGVYPLTVVATNGAAPDASVNFTLTVTQTPGLISVPMQNLSGLGAEFTGPGGAFTVPAVPSYADIAVGPNHIVQVATSSYAVFSKAGTALAGPIDLTTTWPAGSLWNLCRQVGEPVVRYDRAADRFIIGQVVLNAGQSSSSPVFCLAVSQTGDPTGAYYFYQFTYPTGTIVDSPRLGVWLDGYYLTFNSFTYPAGAWQGATICALDRTRMLAGVPATQQCFLESAYFGLVPSDVDGPISPPAGAPNYVVGLEIDSLGNSLGKIDVFRMHVDWTTPSNTSTGLASVDIAPYVDACSSNPTTWDCIPQAGTSTLLDSQGGRLMYRAAYRNYGDHESIVVLHAVGVGSSTGVRWYELRNPGSPTIFQQGTFAPDADHRWVASGAMDGFGDLALGYSVSSPTIKPQIRYAGRLASDPLGQLSRGEATIGAGAGAQTSSNRWGDTSALRIDPSDDCTFWYTNQYLPVDGSFNWQTRIASFRILPSCATVPLATTGSATGVTIGGATLAGSVSSNGATTTVTFEYGTTASYGNSIAAIESPLASGATSASVSAVISSLTCGTLYHFRVGASNASGNVNGSDATFTTAACPSLTVSKTGTGTGTVTSLPSGINCGSSCSAQFSNGAGVTLTAVASAGSAFTGWSGSGYESCGNAPTCIVTMSGAITVAANFTQLVPLTIQVVGSGSGHVTGPAIDCSSLCVSYVLPGASMTLSEAPNLPSSFGGWGQDCSANAQTATCGITVGATGANVLADFDFVTQVFLSVQGPGQVAIQFGNLIPIDCPPQCQPVFFGAGSVDIYAYPHPGAAFTGWVGPQVGGAGDPLPPCAPSTHCNTLLNAGQIFLQADFGPAYTLTRPDFNGDLKPDIIWSNTTNGATYVWYMNGPTLISDAFIAQIDPSWRIQGVADFNGDGHVDLVWRNTADGNCYVWYMNGTSFITDAFLFQLPPQWAIQGVADFNGDGHPDFLMRNTDPASGVGFAWYFNNNVPIGDDFLFGIDPTWKVEQVGDLDGDGQPDLLFRSMTSGLAFAWYTQYNAGHLSLAGSSPPIFSIDPGWEIVQLEDWNGDAQPDLLFRNAATGVVFIWYLNGTTLLPNSDFVIQIDPSWEIVPRH